MREEIKFKKSGFKPLVCTAIFSLLFGFSFAQKEVDFQFNLEKGMCFEVQTSSTSNGTHSTGGKEQENTSETNMVFQYQVVKKTPTFYVLNFMYTDYYFKAMMGEREIIANPKKADKLNILDGSTQIAMMMNKPFYAELSPKGKVLAVKENKEIEKEFKAKTKNLSPALREQVYMMVATSKSEALIKNIEIWTSYMPASAVKIGDKWRIQKDSTYTTDYTFVAETDSTYVIEGVGNSKIITTNEIQKGMVMIMTNETEFTITIEVDKQTFLPKIITQEMEILGKAEIPNFPNFPQSSNKSYGTLITEIRSCNQ